MTTPPFSSRNRGSHSQIDNDFPPSARNGLIHILINIIDKEYVESWIALARELQRIGRFRPIEYNKSITSDLRQAQKDAEKIIEELEWEKIYDFCERLHNYLARATGYFWNDEFQEKETKAEVQSFIAEELQRLFEEESLAFEFSQGLVHRRGRKHTIDLTARAKIVLGDPRLTSARKHYDKALAFFRNPSKPDFENTVKEAVCAVEAAGKALFPEAQAKTLGDLTKWLSSSQEKIIPKTLIQTISGTYAYRCGGDGVGHGGSVGGAATKEVAEYVLAICASQVIYFTDISNSLENETPF